MVLPGPVTGYACTLRAELPAGDRIIIALVETDRLWALRRPSPWSSTEAASGASTTATGRPSPPETGLPSWVPPVRDQGRHHPFAVDGEWMVQGKWAFGSCCKHASWAPVGIEYDPADAGGGGGRGMVALRREQYEILHDWHVMGLSGSAGNSLRVQDEVFVPAHRLIGLADFPWSDAAALRVTREHRDRPGDGAGSARLLLRAGGQAQGRSTCRSRSTDTWVGETPAAWATTRSARR